MNCPHALIIHNCGIDVCGDCGATIPPVEIVKVAPRKWGEPPPKQQHTPPRANWWERD